MRSGWCEKHLGEICELVNGRGFKPHEWKRQGLPIIRIQNLNGSQDFNFFEGEYNPKIEVNSGQLLFAWSGSRGASFGPHIWRGPKGVLNYHTWKVVPKEGTDRDFLFQLLEFETQKIEASSHGASALVHVQKGDMEQRLFDFPPLPEQRKIAEILRTWDLGLEKLEALRAAKVLRVTSARQRLFEAAYASHNQLQRARDMFETVSERARPDLPLLAVMQDIGIVRRDELDRRVAMPDGDTSSYKVVRPGDFVISLRSFEGGLEYSTVTGLVSPAYTILRPTTKISGEYYRHFFKSRSFIGRLDKLIFGIRDGKQIAFRDFGDIYIPAPPVEEQEANAQILSFLDADLALEDERIAALTRQKRGLMQKLLTGEWRVKVEEAA